MRPPFPYAGSKRRLLRHLMPLYSAWRVANPEGQLVELFGGSAALAWHAQPRRALINDTNETLIAFYRLLQAGASFGALGAIDALTYYKLREEYNALERRDSERAARLFYHLISCAYGAVWRVNRRGEMNTTFDASTSLSLLERDWTPYHRACAEWEFQCGDFSKVTPAPEDLVFADPPYATNGVAYSGAFSEGDHERLLDYLERHTGAVIITNAALPYLERLYTERGYQVFIACRFNDIAATRRAQIAELVAWRGIALTTQQALPLL